MPNHDDDPWPVPRIPFWKEYIIEKDMGDKITPTIQIIDKASRKYMAKPGVHEKKKSGPVRPVFI